ncbi:alkaline phosphatase D family protein, partial [Burkholderia sola]
FMLGQAVSGTGRCRTAPAPGSLPQRLRLAYASCQRWEHGYYAAWRQVVQDAPDLVIFLGDYIYEYATPAMTLGLARTHNLRAAQTLQDYRDRYALHKSDPLLQAAHALCNWS